MIGKIKRLISNKSPNNNVKNNFKRKPLKSDSESGIRYEEDVPSPIFPNLTPQPLLLPAPFTPGEQQYLPQQPFPQQQHYQLQLQQYQQQYQQYEQPQQQQHLQEQHLLQQPRYEQHPPSVACLNLEKKSNDLKLKLNVLRINHTQESSFWNPNGEFVKTVLDEANTQGTLSQDMQDKANKLLTSYDKLKETDIFIENFNTALEKVLLHYSENSIYSASLLESLRQLPTQLNHELKIFKENFCRVGRLGYRVPDKSIFEYVKYRYHDYFKSPNFNILPELLDLFTNDKFIHIITRKQGDEIIAKKSDGNQHNIYSCVSISDPLEYIKNRVPRLIDDYLASEHDLIKHQLFTSIYNTFEEEKQKVFDSL